MSITSTEDRLSFEKPGYRKVTPGQRGALKTPEIEKRLSGLFPDLAFPFLQQDHLHGVTSDVHVLCKKHGLISRVGMPGMLYGGTQYACTQCASEAGAFHRAAHPKHYTPNSMSRRGLQSGIFIEVKKEFPDAVWEATLPDGKELDIYIPSLKIGIELNGQYWHSTEMKPNPMYHRDKNVSAGRCDIAVIHVWEEMAVAPFTNILNMLKLSRGDFRLKVRASDRLQMLTPEEAEEFHMTWNCKLPTACRSADYHLAYMQRGKPKAVVSFQSCNGLILAASTSVDGLNLNWMASKFIDLFGMPYVKLLADCITPLEWSWANQTMSIEKYRDPIPWDLDSGYKLCCLTGTQRGTAVVFDCGHAVFTSK